MRFVRPLTEEEVRRLEVMRRNEIGRVAQRAHMLLLSNRHMCVAEIARIFDVAESTVRRWIERFEQEGIDCLTDKPRSGRPPKASAATRYQIERDVLNPPAEYGYPFSNWALGNLVDHIMETYSISVSKSTVRRILKGLDFRFNRPRHSPKKGRDMLLKAKMKEILEVLCSPVAGNHVLYEDESDLHLLPPLRAMWMKKGKQVRIPTPGTNKKKSIFGVLDIRTGRWIHRIYDTKRTEQFIDFLNHVESLYPTGKIHIMLDNYKIHKAKKVQEWLAKHPRVRLHFLPAYMPELNPVEKIWWRLKAVVAANRLYGTMDALIEAVEEFLAQLTTPEVLRLAA